MLNIKKVIKFTMVLLVGILLVITSINKFNNNDNMIISIDLTNLYIVSEPDKIKEDARDKLLAEIEKFQYINKEFYTNDSYNDYSIKINKAISIYNSIDSSLEEITNIAGALQLSYENLTLIYGKDNLKALLDYIKTIDLNKYTPSSIDKLSSAYNDGLKAYNDSSIVDDDIKANIININRVIHKLNLLADFTQLESLINNWESLDKEWYSEKSIEYVNSIYNKAKLVYENKNSTQAELDLSYLEFNNALDKLPEVGDKKKLLFIISEINKLERAIYNQADFKVLKTEADRLQIIIEYDDSKANIEYFTDRLDYLWTNLRIDHNRKSLFNTIKEGKEKDISKEQSKIAKQYTSLLLEANQLLYDENASDEEILEFIDRINNFSFKIKKDILWWPNIVIWSIIAILIIGGSILFYNACGAEFGTGFVVTACVLLIPSYFCFAIFGMPYLVLWANVLINIGVGLIGLVISVGGGILSDKLLCF